MPPTEKFAMPIFPTPAWRVKAAVPPPLKGQAHSEDWLRQYFYPHGTEVFSSSPYAPKFNPPSERSPNPNPWGNWRGLAIPACRNAKGATVKPPFVSDTPRLRGYAARGVFKLDYGEPFFNYSKTRFASFALKLKSKGFGNKQPLWGDRRMGEANRRKVA